MQLMRKAWRVTVLTLGVLCFFAVIGQAIGMIQSGDRQARQFGILGVILCSVPIISVVWWMLRRRFKS